MRDDDVYESAGVPPAPYGLGVEQPPGPRNEEFGFEVHGLAEEDELFECDLFPVAARYIGLL